MMACICMPGSGPGPEAAVGENGQSPQAPLPTASGRYTGNCDWAPSWGQAIGATAFRIRPSRGS